MTFSQTPIPIIITVPIPVNDISGFPFPLGSPHFSLRPSPFQPLQQFPIQISTLKRDLPLNVNVQCQPPLLFAFVCFLLFSFFYPSFFPFLLLDFYVCFFLVSARNHRFIGRNGGRDFDLLGVRPTARRAMYTYFAYGTLIQPTDVQSLAPRLVHGAAASCYRARAHGLLLIT